MDTGVEERAGDRSNRDGEPKAMKRRIVFIVIALVGVAAAVVGILNEDPETIYRLAAQI